MAIRSNRTRSLLLPPPMRIDRGVPGVFHRGTHRRRANRRRWKLTGGERRLGTRLEQELAGWATVLHSRLPDADLECQPIDHLVVSPAGVWVILADHRSGRVDHSVAAQSVAEGQLNLTKTATACRAVLASIGFDWLDVQLAICMTNARVGHRPLQIDDVWVARPAQLTSLMGRPGPLYPLDVATVAAELSRRFPAAR